ncbi:MAG: DUF835 domain-containing protein [Thermoplasmata archaeon]
MKGSSIKSLDSSEIYKNLLNELLRDLENLTNYSVIQSQYIKNLITKYREQIINVENILDKKIMQILQFSSSYMINTDKFEENKVYNIFIISVIGKYYKNGLFILKENPQNHFLMKMLSLKKGINVKYVWLTNIKNAGNFDTVSPSNMVEISRLISDYLKNIKDQESMILLEGLETIKFFADKKEDWLRYLTYIKDQISTSKSILLIPFKYSAFTQEELGLLKGNFTEIS